MTDTFCTAWAGFVPAEGDTQSIGASGDSKQLVLMTLVLSGMKTLGMQNYYTGRNKGREGAKPPPNPSSRRFCCMAFSKSSLALFIFS